MRKKWRLPEEKEFWYTGKDWSQIMLDKHDPGMRRKILLLLWRAWFLRDNCVHNDGKESVSRSVHFLVQYEDEIRNLSLPNDGHESKRPWSLTPMCPTVQGANRLLRRLPNGMFQQAIGVVKLNTDAGFLSGSGQSWAGAVARDNMGLVFYSACKTMTACKSVEEAEGLAIWPSCWA